MTMELNEIAKKLHAIVREAEFRAIKDSGISWKAWKEQYEWIKNEIQSEREKAEELLADMKANGLTAGSIEAEGYLRCAITLLNTIKQLEDAQ